MHGETVKFEKKSAINLLNIKYRIQMLQSHDHRRYKAERHHCVKP